VPLPIGPALVLRTRHSFGLFDGGVSQVLKKSHNRLIIGIQFLGQMATSWVLVMPEAMNPPLIATLIFLRDGYLILEFLWKNSV